MEVRWVFIGVLIITTSFVRERLLCNKEKILWIKQTAKMYNYRYIRLIQSSLLPRINKMCCMYCFLKNTTTLNHTDAFFVVVSLFLYYLFIFCIVLWSFILFIVTWAFIHATFWWKSKVFWVVVVVAVVSFLYIVTLVVFVK